MSLKANLQDILPVAILAGGVATRLRPLTEMIPKALVEVAGEPFIVHQLRLLKQHYFKKVVLCVGYRGEMIEEVIGNGQKLGLEVKYSYDGPALLGTGGALKKALPLLGKAFFVLYGDAYLECDYRDIQSAFLNCNKIGLLTVFHNSGVWDTSNIVYEQGKIINYDKDNLSSRMEYIDYGVAILKKEAFSGKTKDAGPFDLAQIYQHLIKQGEMAGYEVTKRFYEIGSYAGLQQARKYLKRKYSQSKIRESAYGKG